MGEIDLVAEDGDTLVIVEVKTRRTDSYGTALEAVTRAKQQQLVKLATLYLSGLEGPPRSCRFDVVAVSPASGGGWTCELIQNAFSA
jgi:putative endonuclease